MSNSQKIISRIFNTERSNFFLHHHLDDEQFKAYNYIAACGTDTFGFNTYMCEDCHHKVIHYNSCGNRNCPSCQVKAREEWIEKFSTFILDGVTYFHIVFTVPDSLNELFLNNKSAMYNLLFDASSKTLLKACEKELGQIGFTAILHTWGQNLCFHPHIHMIVSGGGLSTDHSGNAVFIKSNDHFLVSKKVLSKIFKGKFMSRLKKLSLADSDGNPIDLRDEPYKSLVDELYRKEWVVYVKEPFNNTKAILNYIGRYSHRVAISNSRIISYEQSNHSVTFSYKDYKDESKTKEMTLDANEFIRRFTLHILPSRFIKIRHYGFMSNSNRKTKIPLCRKLLNISLPQDNSEDKVKAEITPIHRCPKCNGMMFLHESCIVDKPKFNIQDRVT